MHLLRISDSSVLGGLDTAEGLPGLDPALLSRHAPDAHWVLLGDKDLCVGRVSLWWQSAPEYAGHRLGILGHYAADGIDVGLQLIAHACAELRARNRTLAVGPMDGNTWRNYRWITETNGEPPFFLEPNHPPDWPRHFIESGFQSLANYASSVDEHLDEVNDVQALRAAERMARLGVQLRTLNLAQFESELRTIHRLVTASFLRGFLYQPVSENEFMAQYQAVRPYVRPELVTIATHEDRPVGFSFALPDWLQKQSGRPMDTAIIKTLAILPERRYAGLGSHLVEATRRAARDLGFRRLIHALMHEANPSRAIRADFARVFRRYTLFAKAL